MVQRIDLEKTRFTRFPHRELITITPLGDDTRINTPPNAVLEIFNVSQTTIHRTFPGDIRDQSGNMFYSDQRLIEMVRHYPDNVTYDVQTGTIRSRKNPNSLIVLDDEHKMGIK